MALLSVVSTCGATSIDGADLVALFFLGPCVGRRVIEGGISRCAGAGCGASVGAGTTHMKADWAASITAGKRGGLTKLVAIQSPKCASATIRSASSREAGKLSEPRPWPRRRLTPHSHFMKYPATRHEPSRSRIDVTVSIAWRLCSKTVSKRAMT